MKDILNQTTDLTHVETVHELSNQQQAVIDWIKTGKGSLILLARAGCGKTYTILRCVETILDGDYDVRVFIGAFNKSIAEEIKAALENGGLGSPGCVASTLHSAGFGAWRKMVGRCRVDDRKVGRLFFNHLDSLPEGEQTRLRECIRFFTRTVSLAKQNSFGVLIPFEDDGPWYELIDHFGLEDSLPEDEVVSLREAVKLCQMFYEQSLDQCKSVIDFDDMILAPLYFNAKMPQKDWVFIDEAQDTNSSRRALALKMLAPRGRFVAVGDDKQAIYGFTGANSDSLDIIRRETGAITLPLTTTYRCAKSIIREAQKYVPDIQAHPDAIEGTVRTITLDNFMEGEFQQLTPNDVILCRLNKPLVSLAYDFLKQGKGCFIEGRDIGNGLIELAKKWKKITSVPHLIHRLETYEAAEQQKWQAKGRPEMAQGVEDKVACLMVICEQVPDGSVDDLVAEITKIFGDTPKGRRPHVVTLSSIHKSKGREWNRVYALGFNQLIPSPWARKDWQLEQESNLAYVCETRAKMELTFLEMMED